MEYASPFAYFIFLSGSGVGIAVLLHFFSWFLAPERVTYTFNQAD